MSDMWRIRRPSLLYPFLLPLCTESRRFLSPYRPSLLLLHLSSRSLHHLDPEGTVSKTACRLTYQQQQSPIIHQASSLSTPDVRRQREGEKTQQQKTCPPPRPLFLELTIATLPLPAPSFLLSKGCFRFHTRLRFIMNFARHGRLFRRAGLIRRLLAQDRNPNDLDEVDP